MELSELAWPVKGLEVSLEQAREESHMEKKKGVGPGERTRILGLGLLWGSPADGNHRLFISQLTERKTGMFSGEKWGGFGISPLNSPQKSPLKNGSWRRTSDKFSEKPRLVQLPGGNSKLCEKPKAGISCRTKPPWNATPQEQPVPKKPQIPRERGSRNLLFGGFFFSYSKLSTGSYSRLGIDAGAPLSIPSPAQVTNSCHRFPGRKIDPPSQPHPAGLTLQVSWECRSREKPPGLGKRPNPGVRKVDMEITGKRRISWTS